MQIAILTRMKPYVVDIQKLYNKIKWRDSSDGQSVGFISLRPQVQIQLSPQKPFGV